MDDSVIVVGFLSGTLCFMFLVATSFSHSQNDTLQDEAIERGYAIHCPTTGKWSWIGECEETTP